MSRIAAVVLLLGCAARVSAHHSFFMLFDPSQDVTLTGVVTEFQFIAPHAYILVEVTDEAGTVVAWELETTSPGQLIRAGVTPDVVRTGDEISVVGNPTRDGRPLMRILSITLPDGEEKHLH